MFVDDLLEVIDRRFPPPPRELKFFDYTTKHHVWINELTIINADVGAIKDCLEDFSPEFRAFVLKAAEMICEAGSNADSETS